MCPADYRYPPSVFARPHEFTADTLYVVGGLYGNLPALDAIEELATAERGNVAIVFNGDFHWFDAETQWFSEIAARVAKHRAIRGNVETEIARTGDIGAGCGCAYPESVDDGVVWRSNEILAQLRHAANGATQLDALPMHIVARVGNCRAGIVHGDAWSLAGWRFAHDMLDDPAQRLLIAALREQTGIDIFASTHTCLAALRQFDTPQGALTIINSGAAGMPNFRDTAFGVFTRIGVSPSPHRPLYGAVVDGVHVEAVRSVTTNRSFYRASSRAGRTARRPMNPISRAS
jgi:hypothetical protein